MKYFAILMLFGVLNASAQNGDLTQKQELFDKALVIMLPADFKQLPATEVAKRYDPTSPPNYVFSAPQSNVNLVFSNSQQLAPTDDAGMLELVNAIADGTLDQVSIELDPRAATTVFLVSGGYPGTFEKGMAIRLPGIPENTMLFHAGTREEDGKIYTNGGRVLAVTSLGDHIGTALEMALATAAAVEFEGKYFRRDIGRDLLGQNQK